MSSPSAAYHPHPSEIASPSGVFEKRRKLDHPGAMCGGFGGGHPPGAYPGPPPGYGYPPPPPGAGGSPGGIPSPGGGMGGPPPPGYGYPPPHHDPYYSSRGSGGPPPQHSMHHDPYYAGPPPGAGAYPYGAPPPGMSPRHHHNAYGPPPGTPNGSGSSPRGGNNGFPPRAHLPPRLYSNGEDYDCRAPSKQALQPPNVNANINASSPTNTGDNDDSPTSAANTLDTRSPETARNLNSLEERVPSVGNEPHQLPAHQGSPHGSPHGSHHGSPQAGGAPPTPINVNGAPDGAHPATPMPMPGPYGMSPPGMPHGMSHGMPHGMHHPHHAPGYPPAIPQSPHHHQYPGAYPPHPHAHQAHPGAHPAHPHHAHHPGMQPQFQHQFHMTPPGMQPGQFPPPPPGSMTPGGGMVPPGGAGQPPPGVVGPQGEVVWPCDYCNLKFANWEDCSAHEANCPAGYHQQHEMHGHPMHSPRGAMPMGRNTHRNRNIRGRKMKLSSFPNRGHLLMDENAEYAQNSDRDTYLLSTPADADSLSDRQCYVRSHFVELFISTQADVSTRHSRGAQKLHVGQIGLRCAYCAKLKPRDRAERAICYPSSISRIYQTVADMQRFHFESCVAIPPMVLHTFKSLKTTRPRGVGSPQSYWDRSAREIGLADTAEGIQVNTEEGSGGKAKIEMQKKSVTTGMLARLDPPGMQNQNQVLMKEEEVELGTSLQVHQHHQATAPAVTAPLPLAAVVSSPGSDNASKEEDEHHHQSNKQVSAPASPKAAVEGEEDANILLMLKKTPESPLDSTGYATVKEEEGQAPNADAVKEEMFVPV